MFAIQRYTLIILKSKVEKSVEKMNLFGIESSRLLVNK